jgi:UDP-galactopyranose mutase
MNKRRFLVIGAGFSGAVVAEQLAAVPNTIIDLIDERPHIGGNCYTERDIDTGIMIHKYGPHIFNTDNEKVWNYVRQFCEMVPFINRVKSIYGDQVYSLPINLHTINQFFNKTFNPAEAKEFIDNLGDKSIIDPANFEEQAIKFIGYDLYKAFFYGYTKKQWGCDPKQLPAAILKRLPVRFNYDDNYYVSRFQGIPRNGYTEIFQKMLSHERIVLKLNTKFNSQFDTSIYDHVFYSGPIDSFFNYSLGRLSYRTVFFERHEAIGDYQGNPVINYANASVPHTRVHEHKHFTPWESHEKTVYFKEFSKETFAEDIPYYPKRLTSDLLLLDKYQNEVLKLNNFTFLGRLATYRYMDMHNVIAEALQIAEGFKR